MTLPRVAYVLLWFPKPSETFIFREVVHLRRMGLPVKVFTLYGEWSKDLSPEMAQHSREVVRLGIPVLRSLPEDLLYWWKIKPALTMRLLRTVPLRRWSSLEVTGESWWAFLSAFHLARRFQEESIEHIHAPWADGCATAAWVASELSGIPFSFAGKAHDIFPPDGALKEKIWASAFVRTNNSQNRDHLTMIAGRETTKIHLVYNGHTLTRFRKAPVRMEAPYRLLSIGRFARTKGFDILIKAMKILDDLGLDFHLTLVGSGFRGALLKVLCKRLGINHRVSFPGFVSHDRISELFYSADMFVLPCVIHASSDRDGIPNVIMESLLHHVPVISTNVSGIGDVIQDHETGLVVSPGDTWGLARAVIRMIGDRTKALQMAERGNARVLEQFDPDRNFGQMFELLVGACAPRSPH